MKDDNINILALDENPRMYHKAKFDYKVKAMDREITLADEEALYNLLAEYNEFDEDEKKQASTKRLLDELIIEAEGIKNPNLAVVKKAILKYLNRIIPMFA